MGISTYVVFWSSRLQPRWGLGQVGYTAVFFSGRLGSVLLLLRDPEKLHPPFQFEAYNLLIGPDLSGCCLFLSLLALWPRGHLHIFHEFSKHAWQTAELSSKAN